MAVDSPPESRGVENKDVSIMMNINVSYLTAMTTERNLIASDKHRMGNQIEVGTIANEISERKKRN